ncbi:MAG: class I SAM-dependent methyltransferase family protein [Candidatus Thorarchaeota archaeon]
MRKVCIQTEQRLGEQVRVLLANQELLDTDFPITKEGSQLFLPLRGGISKQQLIALEKQTGPLTLVNKELAPIQRKPTDLASALKGKLPESMIECLPQSLDIIGEIAIVELDDNLVPYEHAIGEGLIAVNARVSTVFAKEGGVEGICRIRPLRRIAGKDQVTTVHTEYGVHLAIDVTKTYFSPRLGTEHDRVTGLIQPHEVIIDMFTGVGPFAILAAKRQPVKVYAIDINEDAIACLRKSLELNRLTGTVIPQIGDARTIIQNQLVGTAHRVIMNLPNDAFSFLDAAALAIKSTGGIMHFYGITTETQSLDILSKNVLSELAKHGRRAQIINTRIVRPSAPFEFQIVLDIQVSPENTERAI